MCRAARRAVLHHPKRQQTVRCLTNMAPPPNTVPKAITRDLLAFCQPISNADPVFITSVPVQGAVQSFCFENVERKIRKSGGTIAYGWAIWHVPGLYFEAEHHGVWRNKAGGLIDVSPQLGGRRRLLFLPDDGAVYDPFQLRQNIMGPDGDSPEAKEMAELGNRRHSVMVRCRIPGTAEIRLYEADQIEVGRIDQQIQVILQNHQMR